MQITANMNIHQLAEHMGDSATAAAEPAPADCDAQEHALTITPAMSTNTITQIFSARIERTTALIANIGVGSPEAHVVRVGQHLYIGARID